MVCPDVNILIYAHRQDERVHTPYERWLTKIVEGPEPFALSALCAVAFVRIVTNRNVYKSPTPLATALATVDQIATHPNCRLISAGPDHWQRVAALCRATQATAKLVADAQHAAIAMAEGCTLVTRDSDFGRFAPLGLRWQHLVL